MLLSEYKFESKHSKESVERGIKFLESTQEKLKTSKLNNFNGMYAKLSTDPRYDVHITNGQCHARIGQMIDGECDLIATLTHDLMLYPNYRDNKDAYPTYNYNSEITERFTAWFTQQSMYSRFFVPMPLEFNVRAGLLISTDIPPEILQNMCIISRHTREKGDAMRVWGDLTDKGVNPDIAYVIATNIVDYGKTNPVVASGYNGHYVLPTSLSIKDAALRAVGGDLWGLEDIKDTYRTRPTIYGGSALFVTGGSPRMGNATPESCKRNWLWETKTLIEREKNKEDKTVSVVPNPFKRSSASTESTTVSRDFFYNAIVPRFVHEVETLLIERDKDSIKEAA